MKIIEFTWSQSKQDISRQNGSMLHLSNFRDILPELDSYLNMSQSLDNIMTLLSCYQ